MLRCVHMFFNRCSYLVQIKSTSARERVSDMLIFCSYISNGVVLNGEKRNKRPLTKLFKTFNVWSFFRHQQKCSCELLQWLQATTTKHILTHICVCVRFYTVDKLFNFKTSTYIYIDCKRFAQFFDGFISTLNKCKEFIQEKSTTTTIIVNVKGTI